MCSTNAAGNRSRLRAVEDIRQNHHCRISLWFLQSNKTLKGTVHQQSDPHVITNQFISSIDHKWRWLETDSLSQLSLSMHLFSISWMWMWLFFVLHRRRRKVIQVWRVRVRMSFFCEWTVSLSSQNLLYNVWLIHSTLSSIIWIIIIS